jgi:lantibiotic modifying enzyme
LSELEPIDFTSGGGSPLKKLCAAGVKHAWNELERTTKRNLLQVVGGKARASLRRHLQRTLEQITEPSLELEWKSFILAMESLGFGQGSAEVTQRMFLRERPSYRLGSLFQKFPVLARLWILAIDQWRNHIAEILNRIRADRNAISRYFCERRPLGLIRDMRPGLSDPHRSGRSVTLVEFDSGRVIYKPRSGWSETRWFELLAWMNRHGFSPKLRIARILERCSYSWMEFVEVASCKNKAGVRRFYERLGAMIAAAYLLKAVDCHRDNVIAAGEHPVLVDVDALWHVSPLTKTQSRGDVLCRTGFFPNARRRSLQSRSSVLGSSNTGNHLARIDGRPVMASDYVKEILNGFSRGWKCLLGTARRRVAFRKRLARIRAHPRRWIYLATEKYATIRNESVRPVALRSEEARQAVIRRLCTRSSASPALSHSEIKALSQLDLPYFVRRTAEAMPSDESIALAEITDTIRIALLGSRARPGKAPKFSKKGKCRSGSLRRSGVQPRYFLTE